MALFDSVFCWAEDPLTRGPDSFYPEPEEYVPRPQTSTGSRVSRESSTRSQRPQRDVLSASTSNR
eukprot:3446109-Pyramimonas_sp.AAC.2